MIKACVIGWPVEHSRSPLIHSYWLARYGIDGSYEKRAVEPVAIEAFLRDFGVTGFAGGNVTIPHKEVAFVVADEPDEAARAIGAANTLWLDETGRLCASNTDAYGFMAHLANAAPGWQAQGASVMVLGAGGAARAILYGLLQAGVAQVLLSNRSRERAANLAAAFGPRVELVDWDDKAGQLGAVSLLVNATSLGMAGQPLLDLPLDPLPEGAVVADIVYSPLKTVLLKAAKARGLTAVDGLGMLLHQAVPGFERWFGVRPEVTDELRALVVADLNRGSA